MKFNQKELAAYAAIKSGKSDKEGLLYMRESDKKKDAYSLKWFSLSGNLLFYSKDETKDSPVLGVIVLEQCKVESEAHTGNRNAFKLLFHDNDGGYWFYANSARETDEWIRILNCSSYEQLRSQFSELRGQLLQLTGKDPISDGGPLGDWSVNTMPTLPTSAPGYDGEPVFELCLSCSSLISSTGANGFPSPMVITNCLTPPQAYWIRYAQTEVIENDCDPQFTTAVVFFEGKIFSSSQLKFDIFDVFNKAENLMYPLGHALCDVKDIVCDPTKTLKLEIIFNEAITGYLLLHARMCGRRHSVVKPTETLTIQQSQLRNQTSFTAQSFRSPLDNIVIRRFQFPLCDTSEEYINATEIMGECLFSYSIPIQLLELFIAEENSSIAQLKTLTGLTENWEIILQEVILELKGLVEHYEKNREELQVVFESGKLFKKSVEKGSSSLEFVPVNLHIQELKYARSTEKRERIMYTCITVGCPSAYSLKYKHGGLARLQASIPRLSIGGSFTPSTENKPFRVKQLLKRISINQTSIKTKVNGLLSAAQANNNNQLKKIITSLIDMVASFENHCKVMLLNEGLRDWYNSLDPAQIPAFIRSLTELSPNSILSNIEQHLVSIEAQVDGIVNGGNITTAYDILSAPVIEFIKAFDNVIDVFHSTLFFILLKEQHVLQLNKVSLGLKGFKHRRDVVFTQAVTSIVTSFVMKLLRSISSKHFLSQIQEIGFLVHWESLLSTHSDETGMLEDFIVAIHDINTLKFKLVQATSVNDTPRVQGTRYRIVIDIPVQPPMYRILPAGLQNGKEISVVAVLFTQGINEQQSLADTFGDSHLQDQINFKNFQKLSLYCEKFREKFGTSGIPMSQRAIEANDLLHQLNGQIHTRKAKNTDILTLSQALCRILDCGRITSCKSAKDRTAMSVTLEQAHILLQSSMDPSFFQQALDTMRSQGTRIRNCEKNVGSPLYAFNALQVVTLPKNYRPPEGTYKKLQT